MTVQAATRPAPPQLRTAGLVDRFLARLLDWVALDVVLSLLLLFTPRTFAMASFLVVSLGYYVALESRRGRTPGQRVMGLEVVALAGGRPTTSQSLRRHLVDAWPLGYAVPVAGAVLGPLAVVAALAGAAAIALALHRAASPGASPAAPWHDRLAGTRVLHPH